MIYQDETPHNSIFLCLSIFPSGFLSVQEDIPVKIGILLKPLALAVGVDLL